MSAMYDRHEVSVKVALYSSDGKRVLLMYYPHDGYSKLKRNIPYT